MEFTRDRIGTDIALEHINSAISPLFYSISVRYWFPSSERDLLSNCYSFIRAPTSPETQGNTEIVDEAVLLVLFFPFYCQSSLGEASKDRSSAPSVLNYAVRFFSTECCIDISINFVNMCPSSGLWKSDLESVWIKLVRNENDQRQTARSHSAFTDSFSHVSLSSTSSLQIKVSSNSQCDGHSAFLHAT